MWTDWLPRLAAKCRRTYRPGNRAGERDVDVHRVRSELEAIRLRFPDHS